MHTLRDLRLAQHLTVEDLAQQTGAHPSTVYRWEAGARSPRARQLRRLAAALRADVAAVLAALDATPEGPLGGADVAAACRPAPSPQGPR